MQYDKHDLMVLGQKMTILDYPKSKAASIVADEVNRGCYSFERVKLQPGDLVLEIGAHIGIVAITLAKKYGCKVYSFEPFAENYMALLRNVEDNGVGDLVIPSNYAVTSDGRPIRMIGNPTDNSGGATACLSNMFLPNHVYHDEVPSIGIRDVMKNVLPDGPIKLFKIDCEGSEHEIIGAMLPEHLQRIQHMRGEFHMNVNLQRLGYDVQQTYMKCIRYIPKENVSVQSIRMAE